MLGALSSCKPEPESYLDYLDPQEQLSGGEGINFTMLRLWRFPDRFPVWIMRMNCCLRLAIRFSIRTGLQHLQGTTARDGLGPMFNARACSGCHFKDGRGRPPEYMGEVSHGLLIRLSVSGMGPHGEPVPHDVYGGQLQDQAISNVTPEGSFAINYTEVPGQFSDGTSYSLRRPEYQLDFTGYGGASGVMFSPRVANQMIGLGLLEALSESTILERSDPMDSDGDGISGRPNYVWDKVSQSIALGRFGWKANEPSLLQQSAGAFLGDMGITSFVNPVENCTSPQLDCPECAKRRFARN